LTQDCDLDLDSKYRTSTEKNDDKILQSVLVCPAYGWNDFINGDHLKDYNLKMERRILHGNITPNDIAHALMAEFNRGNLHAQTIGQADKLAVQISTRMGAQSGGQTALTISIQRVEDGIMIEIGEQAWLGMAASLGQTALSAFRNPFNLLGRLDDLAQDIENIQLQEVF